MFVPGPSEGHKHCVSRTKLYKFWWRISAKNAQMKHSRDRNLDEAVYIAFIYHVPDS